VPKTVQDDRPRTAGWVRVRLTAPQDVPGPRGVSLTEDEVVFQLDRRYFRSMAWFVDRPTFGEWLRSRRKQYPNSHTRWSGEEREQLAKELGGGQSWQRIADGHGRTVHAVQREAVKDGLVAADAFPRPGVV